MHELINEALILVAFGTLAPLVAISLTAGIVTAIQSIIQVQEQSIVHLVRIVTLAALVIVCGEVVHRHAVALLHSAIRLVSEL